MKNQNFSTTILVNESPEAVFAAVNNVRGWWSEEIEGDTDKPGGEFTYRYQDVHYCKMKVIEFIPNKRVVWFVLDNYFNFTKDKTEWKGTRVIFEIQRKGGKTELHFTHEGLVPEYECFDLCSNAWGSYINGSLQSLISAGKGTPNKREKGVSEKLSA